MGNFWDDLEDSIGESSGQVGEEEGGDWFDETTYQGVGNVVNTDPFGSSAQRSADLLSSYNSPASTVPAAATTQDAAPAQFDFSQEVGGGGGGGQYDDDDLEGAYEPQTWTPTGLGMPAPAIARTDPSKVASGGAISTNVASRAGIVPDRPLGTEISESDTPGGMHQPVPSAAVTTGALVTSDDKLYGDRYPNAGLEGMSSGRRNFVIEEIKKLEAGTNKSSPGIVSAIPFIGKGVKDFQAPIGNLITSWQGKDLSGANAGNITMAAQGIKIGNIPLHVTNWDQAVFALKSSGMHEAEALRQLQEKASWFPRTDAQATELFDAVRAAPPAKPDGTVVPATDPVSAARQQEMQSKLIPIISKIQQQVNLGTVMMGTPEEKNDLLTKLSDLYVKSMMGGIKIDDQVVDYAWLKENGKIGGGESAITLDQVDQWSLDVLEGLIEGYDPKTIVSNALPVGAGQPPRAKTPPVVPAAPVSPFAEKGFPKTVDEMSDALATMDPMSDSYHDYLSLYSTMIKQESGGEGGTGAGGTTPELDRALEDLRTAQREILHLKDMGEMTAERQRALTDWQKYQQTAYTRVEEQRNLLEDRSQRAAATGQMEMGTDPFTGRPYTQETIESRQLRQTAETAEAQRVRDEALRVQSGQADIARLGVAQEGATQQTLQAEQAKIQAETAKTAMENAQTIAKAQLTGILDGDRTLAHKELSMTQRLREAEMSGKLYQNIGGDLAPEYKEVDTIAGRTFALNEDIASRKMTLEEEMSQAASRRENTRVNYESMRAQNQSQIERGQLQEAIVSRQEMNRIKEIELDLSRDNMRLTTLMSLMNPTAMLMAQRMGIIPQLEAAMGIDLDIPEIPEMLPGGMTVPTSQMLALFSPQDQQLMLAESSFRTGMAAEDVWSVIHRQTPGAPGGMLRRQVGGR